MTAKWIKTVVVATGGLLLAAALVRFLVLLSPAQALALPDPLLGVSLRWAVLAAGVVELAAGLFCLLGSQVRLQVATLAWLATNWLIYRLGLHWLEVHPQGTFLGLLNDPLKLAGTLTGYFISALPFLFVVLCYSATVGICRGQAARDYPKMFCPACGGHIKFAQQNLGQRIACPHCHAEVDLRRPDEKLRMSCFFCQGHLEFPAHALGTKMPCPHCQRDITLVEPKPERSG